MKSLHFFVIVLLVASILYRIKNQGTIIIMDEWLYLDFVLLVINFALLLSN